MTGNGDQHCKKRQVLFFSSWSLGFLWGLEFGVWGFGLLRAREFPARLHYFRLPASHLTKKSRHFDAHLTDFILNVAVPGMFAQFTQIRVTGEPFEIPIAKGQRLFERGDSR